MRGATRSQDPCPVTQPEPGHLVATVDGLDPGEGVTLYATAGPRLAAAAGPTEAALRSRRRLAGHRARAPGRRGRPGARLATVEFVLPRPLTPAQGGVLLAEEVRDEHKVAWLIGTAVDGHLDLEGDGREVTLVRRHPRDRVAPYQLEMAFDGRERLPLDSYDPSFAAAWRSVGGELAGWQRSSGLWDPAGDRRQALARTAGGVAGVAGLLVAVLGTILASRSGPGWLALVGAGGLLAGAGAAAAVGAWELRVRTPAGSGLWLRTESFRRFLAASEAHHAEEAARLGVLRQYTAWAVAVGEVKRWSRAVAASSVAADAAARYPLLAPSVLAGTSAASAAPSSGGSGGGGSTGAVGGGAGGGGGRSW